MLFSLCIMPSFKYAYDLIYSPPQTPFLTRCGAAGASTANGRDMLIYQAIQGDGILLGKDLDVHGVFKEVDKLLNGEF